MHTRKILLASVVLILVAGVFVFLAQAGKYGAGTTKSDDAAKHIEQGTAAYTKNQYEEAIRHYNEALKIDPNNVKAYNNRGVAYSKMSKHDQAISDLNRALGLDPQLTQAYNNRSMAYFRAKDYARACSDLRKYRELGGTPSPEYAKDLESAAGTGRGHC